jgi:hypothetical protein
MTVASKALKTEILRWRGKKSYGLIAKELGTTRNVVAGVCFRADHSGRKSIGTGQYSTPSSRWARKRLRPGPIPREAAHA